MAVHIRIDDVEGCYEQVREYLPNFLFSRLVVCHELGKTKENPHYHIWIETPSSPVNVRNCLRNNCSKFKDLKRDQKCVQPWGREDEDLTYFFKGDDIRETKGFSVSQIDELKDASKLYVEVKKKKRRTGMSTVDELVEECIKDGIQDREGIVRRYVNHCMVHRRPINKFSAASVCRVVECIIIGEPVVDRVVEEISQMI